MKKGRIIADFQCEPYKSIKNLFSNLTTYELWNINTIIQLCSTQV